ncbi:MAG: hypothetical protein M1833_000521 [Piccolia ochrophora]|nr:MAG: hypothetical protein M1833_000521 [Piccolia ochrophora]
MGAEAPFLYDPPTRYSDPYTSFNPKAVSQASLRPPKPKPKQEGPLINFNRHPDSYLILPYGNTKARPMSPRTKHKVKYARLIQLALRCLELLGAIGLLICAICVRKIEATTGWILRVPPGVAILHTVYAMYHLARRSESRTPASSASYMLFASAMDSGLIPFYVFTTMMAQTQRSLGLEAGWSTVFVDPIPTGKIIYAIFLLGTVAGSLHVASLLLSLYLAVIFRKISRMPPDMNPLEDNLTSRHKKKNSELTLTEKRSSQASTDSTYTDLTSSPRNSHLEDPLIAPPRTVPFMRTRNNSTSTMMTYHTASGSARNSRADLPSQLQQSPSRTDLARSSRSLSPTKRLSTAPSLEATTPPKPSHHRKDSLLVDNWYTYTTTGTPRPADDDDEAETDITTTYPNPLTRASSTVSSLRSHEARLASSGPAYHALHDNPFSHDIVDAEPHHAYTDIPLLPRPLESHPPTPPPNASPTKTPARIAPKQPLAATNPNRVGSLKATLYDDLKCATPPLMVGKRASGTPASAARGIGSLPGSGGARVVSNSGTDFDFEGRGGNAMNGNANAGRRREVSGKAMEEGRGGGWLGVGARLRRGSEVR